MDFAQARVSNLGHMASPILQKCSVCGESKGRDDYAGPQWSEGSKKRKCKGCKKRLRGAADAQCTLETMPVEQPGALGSQPAAAGAHAGGQFAHADTHSPTPGEHGALGGQSTAGAGAGAGAAACDVGASADSCFQRRCLGLAAPMHAPVVLRVSAFNVAAFNQNMCMRSGMRNLPTNAFGC